MTNLVQQDLIQSRILKALIKDTSYVSKTKGTAFWRVQPTKYKDPRFYNRASDTRYADPYREVGVTYLAGSAPLAVAESFQHGPRGPGTAVLLQDIEQRSLYQVKAARDLKLVDVGCLNAAIGGKPRELIQTKGQGYEGYRLTQLISGLCMRHSRKIDGMLYRSSVYDPAGSLAEGCNIVLFEGRGTQLETSNEASLMEVLFSNNETVLQFLEGLQIDLE